MIAAEDIMSTDVVVLSPEMSLVEAGERLTRSRIHGAPVVDATEQIVGMVSVTDFVGRAGKIVADIMTPEPVCASEDTPIERIAGLMLQQMVRRVPIVKRGRVVGIVSASDIVRVFLDLHEKAPDRKRVDTEAERSKDIPRTDDTTRRARR